MWPHDCAIAAEGLRRYGFRDEAARVAVAVFDAAAAFEFRLPELFGGFPRDATDIPIESPHANRPQAFAAGAPLLALRTLLGLDVDAGRLAYALRAAEGVGEIRVSGLPVRGSRVELVVRAAEDDEHAEERAAAEREQDAA